MHFILYFDEDLDWAGFGQNPASADCYTLTKSIAAVFGRLGSVSIVYDPKREADPIFEHFRALGADCVLVCFCLPYRVPLGLRCPTIDAFAWAYSVLPTGGGKTPTWASVLAACGRAITFSSCAARAVTAMMGPEFAVVAIAPPLANCEASECRPADTPGGSVEISLRGVVIDSRALGLSADLLVPVVRPEFITAGVALAHRVRSVLRRAAFWKRPARRSQTAKDADRTLPLTRVSLSGTIYTAVIDPVDLNKNLSDLMTAFRWAFHDVPDATLVLKMDHDDFEAYRYDFNGVLTRLEPFQCRIVAIHGRLDDDAFEKLIAATTYYVNASECEALNLPMMQFMARGKPALAPRHSALEDYVDAGTAFVLRSSYQLRAMVFDRELKRRAKTYRLDWESLLAAYTESYRVARSEPERYAALSLGARRRVLELTSPTTIVAQLRAFFALPSDSDDTDSAFAETEAT